MTTKLLLAEHLIAARCPDLLAEFKAAEAAFIAALEAAHVSVVKAKLDSLAQLLAGFAREYDGGAAAFARLLADVRALSVEG